MSDKQPDDLLKQLFAHATPRPRLSSHEEQQVYAVLHDQWQQQTRTRKRRTRVLFALAASVALVFTFGGVLLLQNTGVSGLPDIQVATLTRHIGDTVTLASLTTGAPIERVDQHRIIAGQTLSSGSHSRISLQLISGGQLRLDENTAVVFNPDHSVLLKRGRVYFDSGYAPDAPPIYPLGKPTFRLVTEFGDIQHVGTQFSVAVSATGVTIDVREGEARLFDHDETISVPSGKRLLAGSGGNHEFVSILTYGDAWAWTESMLPPMRLDNTRVSEFLTWVGRETGRKIHYQSDAAHKLAQSESFIGTVDQTPIEALNIWLQTTDLVADVQDDEIRIDMLK